MSENIPPAIFKRYGGKFIEIKKGETCTVQFNVHEEDFNPMGILLGGVYSIYFDLAMGPFSYMSLNLPCTSLDLNVDFLKPITSKDKTVTVKSTIISQSKNYLLFTAEAFNEQKELIATAKSRMKILHLKR